MKNAKFVIMLQVLFLIGIFAFSASAVHQPAAVRVKPSAVTSLALRQEGYEMASADKYKEFQNLDIAIATMKEDARAVIANKRPNNSKEIIISNTNNPVYIVSVPDTLGKEQYMYVIGNIEDSDAISSVYKKDEGLSEELGVFVSPLEKQVIDSISAAAKDKPASAGKIADKVERVLSAPYVIEQLKGYSGKNPELLQAALYNPHLLQEVLGLLETDAGASQALLGLAYLSDAARANNQANNYDMIKQTIETIENRALPADINTLTTSLSGKLGQSGIEPQLAAALNAMDNAFADWKANENSPEAAAKHEIYNKAMADVISLNNILNMQLNDFLPAKSASAGNIEDLPAIIKALSGPADSMEYQRARFFALAEIDTDAIVPLLLEQRRQGISDPNLTKFIVDNIISNNEDSIAKLKSQLNNVKTRLEKLQDRILDANMDYQYSANTKNSAEKTLKKLKELEAAKEEVQARVDILNKVLREYSASAATKASSGGIKKRIDDIMKALSNAGAEEFAVSETTEALNKEALQNQIDAYTDAVSSLKGIRAQSPEAAAAVSESLRRAEASLNIMTDVKNIAVENAVLKDVTGAIIIRDEDIPANQKILLEMLDKSSYYNKALEEKLGCKIRLFSQYDPKKDGIGNVIAISTMPLDNISKRIDIKAITQDAYLPLEQIIVLAKGLLTYDKETKAVLNGTIAQIYKFIAKAPLAPRLLETFLANSVFVLDLPIPAAIDEAHYEQLHKQALAALIAA